MYVCEDSFREEKEYHGKQIVSNILSENLLEHKFLVDNTKHIEPRGLPIDSTGIKARIPRHTSVWQ